MEVFSKYFRRLVTGNAPQIFPNISRAVENPSNYPLLVTEVQKVARDREQAHKIAETIDTADGDLFKDFDLATFMNHFQLDPLEKCILALAFEGSAKEDLRRKADSIIANNVDAILAIISDPTNPAHHADMPLPLFCDFVAQILNSSSVDDSVKVNLAYCVKLRFKKQNSPIPSVLENLMQNLGGSDTRNSLVQSLRRAGPEGLKHPESCKEVLRSSGATRFTEAQIADAILYILTRPDWQSFHLHNLLEVLDAETSLVVDWNEVLRGFDRDGYGVKPDQFQLLFDSFLPLAQRNQTLNVQRLWGGRWNYPETQLSFLTSFLAQNASGFDPSNIPLFRPSLTPEELADAPEQIKAAARSIVKHPLLSAEAVTALYLLAFETPDELVTRESRLIFENFMMSELDLLLCGLSATPQPWSETLQAVMTSLFHDIVGRSRNTSSVALRILWKRERQWVATRLVEIHSQDPMKLPILFDCAVQQGWLDDLLVILNGFGLDLAAQAHSKDLVDVEHWAQQSLARRGHEFASALSTFLTIKAEDEVRTQRGEQELPRTVSLAIKTVHALLEVLEQIMPETAKEKLVIVQRECIQAYPRLINWGEGFDDVIEASSERTHAMPPSADSKMQEHYRRMYSNELDVKSIVEALTRYKRSRDPADQDLFACMIHGLFDEYSCFREYPLDALATTAVLFGGIINYNLVSGIPLRVALGMILEAVKNYPPETSMFKFGLQALVHCFPRLPEWPGFCSQLLEVRSLIGTEAYKQAQEVVQSQPSAAAIPAAPAAPNGRDVTQVNGSGHATFISGSNAPFASVNVEPHPHPEDFEDPDEDTQDKVLFVLNNVSEQNLGEKLRDLLESLQRKHHQWFAHYIVEERAKMQPNFQQLYLDMLNHIDDKSLWNEVLRQTYFSCIKMLNAEATLTKSNERTLLKNLGGWLGSITIARDKPIKFKNVSFKDLLFEAHDTQRLIVAIPFTCKVLLQASKSSVFKPPNPWLMDIIHMLIELYHFAELKLNLKFEIEVLCKELNLDHTEITPSNDIRDRQRLEEDLSNPIGDGVEPFDDYTIGISANRAARLERFSPAAIFASLPPLGPLLVVPSIPGVTQARLRSIIESAIQRSIQEIISQVVERSVTIAAIASAQLIQKDFAMEPSEERVKHSALTMAKQLSGSLAQVTCKEPLRISIANLIRTSLFNTLPNDTAALEGAILMCVNENLDIACNMFVKAAEDRCVPEIEEQLEAQLSLRRRHQTERPNEPFVDPGLKAWAFYLPDPYRLKPGGLNREQMAIYENFGKTPLISSRANEASRQVSGELPNESFPPGSLPETSGTPHPPGSQGNARAQPVPAQNIQSQELNGFNDLKTVLERVQSLMSDLKSAVQEATVEHFVELLPSSNVMEYFNQIIDLVVMSGHREAITLRGANSICNSLYTQTEQLLEIETFVQLLKRFCQISPSTDKEVKMWLVHQEDSRMFNVPVTVSLLETNLLMIEHLDVTLSRAIQSRKPVATEAIDFLTQLVDDILHGERPVALRADLTGSIEAVSQWVEEEPNLSAGTRLLQKLRESGMPAVDGSAARETAEYRDQMEYIFSEWVSHCQNPSSKEKHYVAFLSQLHQKRIMSSQDDSCFFLRACIDMCVSAYENDLPDLDGYSQPYDATDALAKLVIYLIKYQNSGAADAAKAKGEYLSSILSLMILVLNHHHVMRGVNFNQKVFFRLFSSMLYEYHALKKTSTEEKKYVMLAFSEAFLTLQPAYFPGFSFGWLSLVSHRAFLPKILHLPEQAGWESYMKLMEVILRYVGEQLKDALITPVAKELNKGLLKVLLVMHHDFPDFLAENHFWFCEVIPPHCTQLRNLILSACPSSIPELPDPFNKDLEVDLLPEMQLIPSLPGDTEAAVRRSGVQSSIDAALEGGPTDEQVSAIASAFYLQKGQPGNENSASQNVDTPFINSLVLYIGVKGISSKESRKIQFGPNSAHATLLAKLVHEARPEARYFLLSAIANQLRYPNRHTHYFYHVLLYLFSSSLNDAQDLDVPQQISRVMLERLIVHRPHPWGLIVALLKLLKNQAFWQLPFIKAAPEVERLFGGFYGHMDNSQH